MLSKIQFVLKSALPLALLSSPLLLAASQPTDLETYGVYCNESSAPTNSRPVSGSVQPVSTSRQGSTSGQVTSAGETVAVWRDSVGRLSDRATTAVQLLMSNPYANGQSSDSRSENGPSAGTTQNNQSNCLAAQGEPLTALNTLQNTHSKQAATSAIQGLQPLAELPDLGVSPIPELPAEPAAAEPSPIELPAVESPAVDPIQGELPTGEPPIAEIPTAEAPVVETPVVETPVVETAETPVAETPVSKPPAAENPATEPPMAESPVAESPVAESPVAEPPSGEAPPVARPAAVPSTIELPVFEPSSGELPAAESPAAVPPAIESPPVVESPAAVPPAAVPPAASPPAVEYPAVEPPSVDPSAVTPPSPSTELSPSNQPTSLDPNNITPTTIDATPFDGSVIATLASRPDGNYRYLAGDAEFRTYTDAELQQQGGSIFVFKKEGNNITGNLLPRIGQPGMCLMGIVSGNTVTGLAYPYSSTTGTAIEGIDNSDNNSEALQAYGSAFVVNRSERTEAGRLFYSSSVLDLSNFSMINAGVSLPPSGCAPNRTVQ
jgi:hypothetical protein